MFVPLRDLVIQIRLNHVGQAAFLVSDASGLILTLYHPQESITPHLLGAELTDLLKFGLKAEGERTTLPTELDIEHLRLTPDWFAQLHAAKEPPK